MERPSGFGGPPPAASDWTGAPSLRKGRLSLTVCLWLSEQLCGDGSEEVIKPTFYMSDYIKWLRDASFSLKELESVSFLLRRIRSDVDSFSRIHAVFWRIPCALWRRSAAGEPDTRWRKPGLCANEHHISISPWVRFYTLPPTRNTHKALF